MTTSHETSRMNHPTLRRLVDEVGALKVEERITLPKALIPGVAAEMTPRDFETLAHGLRMKGERFYDAKQHPGKGRATRHVMSERDLEGR